MGSVGPPMTKAFGRDNGGRLFYWPDIVPWRAKCRNCTRWANPEPGGCGVGYAAGHAQRHRGRRVLFLRARCGIVGPETMVAVPAGFPNAAFVPEMQFQRHLRCVQLERSRCALGTRCFIGRELHMKPNILHFYPNELAELLMRPGQTFTVEPILCQGSSRRMATRPLRPAGPGRTSASSAASPRRWPSMACLGPFAVWVLRCTLSECGWAWGWRRTQACTRAQSWSTMLTCGPREGVFTQTSTLKIVTRL